MFYVEREEMEAFSNKKEPKASTTFSQSPSNQRRDLLQLLDQDLDKSATLKSTQADYTTPPESPVMPHPLFKTMGESLEKPPVPPPRHKRQKPHTTQNINIVEENTDSTAVL